MNIEQRASIKKLRFETPKGKLASEDLYDLPLKGSRSISLNKLAKQYSKLLKEDVEEDFVDGAKDTEYTDNKLRFDIILSVIQYKKELIDRANKKSSNNSEIAKLEEALESKKDSELKNLTVEELEAALALLKK